MFLINCFKAISHIEAIIKIINIAKTKFLTLKNVNTKGGLTRYKWGQRHKIKTRTAVSRFINAKNIYSLMGWETQIRTVVWQQLGRSIGNKIINAENIQSLIR